MKRRLLLLPLILVLGGCGKMILKRTKIMVVANPESVQVNIITPNRIKLLDDVTAQQVLYDYLYTFKENFFTGRFNLVDANPDYIMEITTINITESVWEEIAGGDDFNLSRLDLEVEYRIAECEEDAGEYHIIKDQKWESLREDTCKDKDTYEKKDEDKEEDSDGDCYWDCEWVTKCSCTEIPKGTYSVVSFGGIEGLMDSHSRAAREHFKQVFKSKQ